MDDLLTHLKTLAPVAEAIVYITRNGAQIEGLSSRLSQQETQLKTGEERLAQIESLCAKAKAGSEQAKASVVEAQNKIEQMVMGAKADAERIIREAKAEAAKSGQAAVDGFKGHLQQVKAQIQAAKDELATITVNLTARKADHKLVMDSLASLKSRLGAA